MAKIERKQPEVHEKSWGREIWFENNPEYCGKSLVFEEGTHTSMHFHVDKLETMVLLSGRMVIELVDPENGEEYVVGMLEGDILTIPRAQPHRIRALEDSVLLEFSTHHEEHDSYRTSPSYRKEK